MNIEIGQVIERKQKKLSGNYVISISWMFGDADNFEEQELCYDVKCKEDVEAFEKVYKCCYAFTESGHDVQLEAVYDYNKFFSKVLNLPEKVDVVYKLFGYIPYDNNAQSQCFLYKFKVWYEDKHENKFELIIKD